MTVYEFTDISSVNHADITVLSRMSANLLTLNSSKTEFIIIGLKQQLSNLRSIPLNSARNLGFYPRDTRVIGIATCLSVSVRRNTAPDRTGPPTN